MEKTSKKTSPPPMEKDSHSGKGKAPYEEGSEPKGETKGNKVLPIDLSHDADSGGKGDSHDEGHKGSPFLGPTKGNKDLPINRTEGVDSHEGGRYIASNDRYHGGRKQSPEGN